MEIAVVYASKTGNTRRAAELIAVDIEERGHVVSTMSVDNLDFAKLAAAELIIIGTWVAGHFVIGQKPGDAGRLAQIPVMTGKDVALFMTYAINPGPALRRMERIFTGQGANVVAGFAWKRNKLPAGVNSYAEAVLKAVKASA
jgi:flavodoxin